MENNSNTEDLQKDTSKSNNNATTTPAKVVKQKNHTFFKLVALLGLGVAGATAYQVFVPDTQKHDLWKQYVPGQQAVNYVTQEEFNQYVQETDAKLVTLTATVTQLEGRPTLKVDWSGLQGTEEGTVQHLNQILEDFAKNLEAYLDKKLETAQVGQLPAQGEVQAPTSEQTTTEQTTTAEQSQENTPNTEASATDKAAQETTTNQQAETPVTTVHNGSTTAQADTTATAQTNLSATNKEQLVEVLRQYITTEEFVNYFRELAVANQVPTTTPNNQVQGETTSGINLAQAVSQLNNLSSETKSQVATLEAQVKELSEQTKTQLTLTDATATKALVTATEAQQKLANKLEDAVLKATNLLVEQSLTEAQTLVANGASLDAIKLRLQLAQSLTDNDTVKSAVQQDLASLTASANTDNDALAVNVSNLLMRVDNLPSIKPNLGLEEVDTNPTNQGFFSTVGNLLSKYISVSKVTDSALADKNANLFIHENLKLSLQTALLAAQTGKQNIFTNSIALALTSLNNYFDEQDTAVASFKQDVAQLTLANFSYNTEYKLSSLAIFAGVTPASDAHPLQGNAPGDLQGPNTQETTTPEQAQQPEQSTPATQPADQ